MMPCQLSRFCNEIRNGSQAKVFWSGLPCLSPIFRPHPVAVVANKVSVSRKVRVLVLMSPGPVPCAWNPVFRQNHQHIQGRDFERFTMAMNPRQVWASPEIINVNANQVGQVPIGYWFRPWCPGYESLPYSDTTLAYSLFADCLFSHHFAVPPLTDSERIC